MNACSNIEKEMNVLIYTYVYSNIHIHSCKYKYVDISLFVCNEMQIIV